MGPSLGEGQQGAGTPEGSPALPVPPRMARVLCSDYGVPVRKSPIHHCCPQMPPSSLASGMGMGILRKLYSAFLSEKMKLLPYLPPRFPPTRQVGGTATISGRSKAKNKGQTDLDL